MSSALLNKCAFFFLFLFSLYVFLFFLSFFLSFFLFFFLFSFFLFPFFLFSFFFLSFFFSFFFLSFFLSSIIKCRNILVIPGTAVVTDKKAALWTDGRYYLQAEKQLDVNWALMKDGRILPSYIYIYIYIYTHTHTHTESKLYLEVAGSVY